MKELTLPDYASFKTTMSARALLPQWIDTGDAYLLFSIEAGAIFWQYRIVKDGGSEQTDFETNSKTTANQPLEVKAGAGRPIRSSASPQPVGTVEHWLGFSLAIAAGASSGYMDVQFSSNVFLKGGRVNCDGAIFGDYLSADVLLKANNAVAIPGIVTTAYMNGSTALNFISDESLSFASYLKLRLTYTAIDTNGRNVIALADYFQ